MQPSSHDLDKISVTLDDGHAVSDAGLLLVGTLTGRLGIEETADEFIDLGAVPGASGPGRKIATLIHSMVAGGGHIDDVDVLRAGSTGQIFGHKVMAPSTCGTFLRGFTFGHIRQLDRLFSTVLERAWAVGAGPGAEAMTIDLDSTICEVYGDDKAGAAYGYTKVLGCHPLVSDARPHR